MNLSLPNSKDYAWFDYLFAALLLVLAGMLLEMAWRDTHPYTITILRDVKVLRKLEPFHFTLESAEGDLIDARFCEDWATVNQEDGLVPGCLLRKLVFIEEPHCLNVRDGQYIYWHDEAGNDLSWDGSICWRAQ